MHVAYVVQYLSGFAQHKEFLHHQIYTHTHTHTNRKKERKKEHSEHKGQSERHTFVGLYVNAAKLFQHGIPAVI